MLWGFGGFFLFFFIFFLFYLFFFLRYSVVRHIYLKVYIPILIHLYFLCWWMLHLKVIFNICGVSVFLSLFRGKTMQIHWRVSNTSDPVHHDTKQRKLHTTPYPTVTIISCIFSIPNAVWTYKMKMLIIKSEYKHNMFLHSIN